MALKHWSTTAADNDDADATINWLENQASSTVNGSARAMMAAVRSWYDDVEWRDWGHTVTRTGNTTFTIAADVTSIYVANRPIRCTDSSTLYGYVASSSYSAPNTTVTVTLDSGNLSASLTAVSLGYSPSQKSIPSQAVRDVATLSGNNTFTGTLTMSGKSMYWVKGADIASASPLVIGADGNFFDVTGTTTIDSYTVPAGMLFMLQFDGALQLTHHATNNNLPGGQNIHIDAGGRLIGFAVAANQVHVLAVVGASSGGVFHYQDQQTSGTAGGGSSAATWHKRTLNTALVTNTITGSSIASSVITLPAGTYRVWAEAPMYQVGSTRLRLRNTSDSTTVLYGSNRYAGATADTAITASLWGKFTITASKNFELQQYAQFTQATNGLGLAASTGEPEIYANIMIIRE